MLGGRRSTWKKNQAFEQALKGIKETLKYAERKGIIITLENHGGVAATSKDLIRFSEAVDSDCFKVNLDTGNFRGKRYSQIKEVAPYVAHVHAKIYELKQNKYGKWFETTLNYNRILQILRKVNYHHYLSLEYEGKEEETLIVPKAVEFLKSTLS
jgi:L-ribulose-5-phosphate 3-epimerase